MAKELKPFQQGESLVETNVDINRDKSMLHSESSDGSVGMRCDKEADAVKYNKGIASK